MDIILVMWVTFSSALCFDVESTRLSPVRVISWSFITLFCICKCDPLYSITVRCKALVGVREYGHTHRPLWLVSWQSPSLMVKHLCRSTRESSNTVKLLFNALSKARPSIIRARGIQPMYRIAQVTLVQLAWRNHYSYSCKKVCNFGTSGCGGAPEGCMVRPVCLYMDIIIAIS